MLIVGGPIIAKLKAFVVDSPLPPMTCTVKLAFVITSGVPVIAPVLLNSSPDGRPPETIDHVYGVTPSLAVNVWL